MIIWWLSDDYLMIIWWLSDDYLFLHFSCISLALCWASGALTPRILVTLAMAQEEQLGFALEPRVSVERIRTDSKGMPRDPWHIVTHRDTPRHLASDAMTATLGTFGRCTLPRYPLGSDMVRHSQIRVCPLSAPLERQSSLETWGFRNLATKNFLLASFPHGHGIETNRPCIVRHQQQT